MKIIIQTFATLAALVLLQGCATTQADTNMNDVNAIGADAPRNMQTNSYMYRNVPQGVHR